MPSSTVAVKLSGLNKVYRSVLPWNRREVLAVRDLDLEVPKGEIFGFLGPNGAGKTTTIKMVAGLIVPDSGSVSFPAFGRKPVLGAVLEGSRNLYWRLSPWENIRYFGEIKGIPLKTLRRQADEMLELFGLSDRRNAPAQTLSRGMQQKLAVVLAFLGEPELMLLDEPTLGLDVASSQTIQRLLKRLCAERGLTIIITTHQMDIAQTLCRRVGIINNGKLVANELVAELVDHFQRQDYLVRMLSADWQKVAALFSGYSTQVNQADRPGQTTIRFKLEASKEMYALVKVFEQNSVELLDFRQETPSLEDVFLSITKTGEAESAGGPE